MLPGRTFEPLAGDQENLYVFLEAFSFNHWDAFHQKVLKSSVMSHETILVPEKITTTTKNTEETADLYLLCLTESPPRYEPWWCSLDFPVPLWTSLSSFSLHCAQPFAVHLTINLLLTASAIGSSIISLFLNQLSGFYLSITFFPPLTLFLFFKALVWLLFSRTLTQPNLPYYFHGPFFLGLQPSSSSLLGPVF